MRQLHTFPPLPPQCDPDQEIASGSFLAVSLYGRQDHRVRASFQTVWLLARISPRIPSAVLRQRSDPALARAGEFAGFGTDLQAAG